MPSETSCSTSVLVNFKRKILIIHSVTSFVQVQANIKAVLQQFAKIKPTVASGSINSALADSNQESLTVKYLSSPRLLNLQLRDAGFRRHFLVQSLILLHACTRKSLNKQDTFKIKQVSL